MTLTSEDIKFKNIETYVVPQGTLEIQKDTFMGCCNLSSVVLPEGLYSIGPNSFADTKIRSIALPASLGHISYFGINNEAYHNSFQGDFAGCTTLEEILISNYGLVELLPHGLRRLCRYITEEEMSRLLTAGPPAGPPAAKCVKELHVAMKRLYLEVGKYLRGPQLVGIDTNVSVNTPVKIICELTRKLSMINMLSETLMGLSDEFNVASDSAEDMSNSIISSLFSLSE